MRVFEVRPDEDNWHHNYSISAKHKWSLPGERCEVCGTCGGCAGRRYPAFGLPPGIDPKPYLDSWPVTPARLKELREPLLRSWGRTERLPAGTEFGPLRGKASGNCGDVGWVNCWTPIFSAGAVTTLTKEGVVLPDLVRAEIVWRSKKAPEFFEPQIASKLRRVASQLARLGLSICAGCGELSGTREASEPLGHVDRLERCEMADNPSIDRSSIPEEWNLARVEYEEGTIVASEHFREAVLKTRLSNITFRELQVSDE